jgi:two-component system sensor histidine kinase/response regulator
LLNLLGNAIKFTPHGTVTLAVEAEAHGETAKLRICVRDTGIGIPTDKLGTIFDPFTQVDNSSTRQFGGTGLGLAICRQLVKAMGGRLWAESEGRYRKRLLC